jgi:hypothetical protein
MDYGKYKPINEVAGQFEAAFGRIDGRDRLKAALCDGALNAAFMDKGNLIIEWIGRGTFKEWALDPLFDTGTVESGDGNGEKYTIRLDAFKVVELIHSQLISAICEGNLTVEEGEAAAQRARVCTLESWPPLTRHNPRDESWWSLASALVWIGTRNFNRVKIWADEFLPAYFEQGNEGLIYHSCIPVNLLSLSHEIDLRACFNLLKNAAAAEKIETIGKPDNGGDTVKIDAFRWAQFSYFQHSEGGFFVRQSDGLDRITGGGFDDVLIKAEELIAAFPAIDAEKPIETIKARRGRKTKPIKEQCFAFLDQLFKEHGEFDPGYDQWNCQARAEEKIIAEYSLSESTARNYVTNFIKARNSENQ